MQVRYLPPEWLQPEMIFGLGASYQDGDVEGLAARLETGELQVYVVGNVDNECYMAVSVIESDAGRELQMEALWVAMAGHGWRFKSYLEFLLMLGKDWGCDRVVTSVKDPRQLVALVKAGCNITYAEVALEIDHGQ
jgi:hypothetical protein